MEETGLKAGFEASFAARKKRLPDTSGLPSHSSLSFLKVDRPICFGVVDPIFVSLRHENFNVIKVKIISMI